MYQDIYALYMLFIWRKKYMQTKKVRYFFRKISIFLDSDGVYPVVYDTSSRRRLDRESLSLKMFWFIGG